MLKDRVCLVTGASIGVGKGIAIALGAAGATVYVTGRSAKKGDNPFGGTVFATAEEVTKRGGKGVAVVCDHSSDDQTRSLVERIEKESGRLDILVNNATAIPDGLTESGPFWKKPLGFTRLLDVGLRSYYTTTWFAAPMLAKQGGLIFNSSSPGAKAYVHGPAYGAAKAGVDKMSHDMAHDFKPFDVAVISVWLGLVKTEKVLMIDENKSKYGPMLAIAESAEFGGRIIDAIYNDPKRMELTGQTFYSAELAERYGVKDIDGSQPPSGRMALGSPTEFSSIVIE
ncbi:MAG TPA: SDR family NAD(P)-dependent oxidoreductase [Candidatus Binataceae bacterium]|nr:SDR family NAD(P)-dependent oxidoreductase [Candidatus Binataceae bacterium]